jgi:hypothetical protein
MHTKFFLENLEGKKPLRRPGHKWKDNIRMDVTEIEWNVVDCIHVVQDKDQWRAVVNTAMKLWFP